MRSHDPFGTCRNCGCHIMWVKTKAGKNMPVDPTMISYRRPGAGVKAKEKIVTPEGEVVCADKVSSESAEGFGYISLFHLQGKKPLRKRKAAPLIGTTRD